MRQKRKCRPRHRHRPPHPPMGQKHNRWLFWQFGGAFAFTSFLILIIGGLFFLTSTLNSQGHFPWLFLLAGCGLVFILPMLAWGIGWRLFRRVADPFIQVISVLEKVAEGDLTVRAPDFHRGRFAPLTKTINHMVGELQRSDEQRRNLTADVAHELRTPLHIIQGNLEGVLDGVYEPSREHIEDTLEETQLLARLVEDLAVLSQAEAGQLSLQLESIDVVELLADVQTSFSGPAENAGIDLILDINKSQPLSISADIDRLNQVLGNLVSNALRHTSAKGIITLGAMATEETIYLSVADTGEGIPAEDLPFVFDRFWRGDQARTHSAGTGGGLGLAIARQLVQAHGGQISVQSEVGVGTTFTVEMPN